MRTISREADDRRWLMGYKSVGGRPLDGRTLPTISGGPAIARNTSCPYYVQIHCQGSSDIRYWNTYCYCWPSSETSPPYISCILNSPSDYVLFFYCNTRSVTRTTHNCYYLYGTVGFLSFFISLNVLLWFFLDPIHIRDTVQTQFHYQTSLASIYFFFIIFNFILFYRWLFFFVFRIG